MNGIWGGFQGAGVKTVVLFFDKGAPTRKIWYYQLDPGRSLGKTSPLNDADLAEFVSRVSARTGMDGPQALYAARAVLEVTDEATQGGIMERLRDSLPDDLAVISESGSRGRLRH